ncbi:MAG: thiamine pyrophosphate-binding protein [Burkholderiales bacterium]|nr:thiamine pyrophosphate-binding protein [Burkholderiales bacterium]
MSSAIRHDTPVPTRGDSGFWGSDVIAEVLRTLDIPYIALNPGASYRWLHDSLVNYLGNRAPQMLLCLHDETAVSIAQGYAKVTDKMMAAALHANVGLLHASMPIFDAWCDRMPVLILGATGPWDAAKRRPWIDWIHTCSDQGGLVRDFTKWDNQPGSVPAAVEALLRAAQIAQTAPRGPVYVNLDSAVQDARLDELPQLPEVARYAAPAAEPSHEALARAAALLSGARNPLMLAGRVSRSLDAWNARVQLAEKLNMRVLSQIKVGAAFPTDHPLHAAPPANRPPAEVRALIASSDVIVSLDWLDLGGTLRQALGDKPVGAKVIQVSCDLHSHRGGTFDYHVLAPADVQLLCEPDAAVPRLLAACAPRRGEAPPKLSVVAKSEAPAGGLTLSLLAENLRSAIAGKTVCFTRLPLGWNGAYTHFRHPLDYIGYDGGAGVGSGPGITVGAALALRGSGRLAIGLHGDGDFLMGNTAVWTATHYRIACLMIVCNNRSFFNDERHQERIAIERGRPPQNRWIGQHIGEPDVDIAAMARSMGAIGIGPIEKPEEIGTALRLGVEAVEQGKVCVIDARVAPGYDAE